jgi:NADH-quinone oxidoreductase subunit N
VFSAALAHAAWGPALVVIGVLTSAVAAFFYIRVLVLMYFSEPSADAITVTTPGILTAVAVGVGALATVVLGVFPSWALDLANSSSVFVP